MIKKEFIKHENTAQQILQSTIHASKETIFQYLATTEGISQWFPQLSFKQEDNQLYLLFDMGDGTFEKMKVYELKKDEKIVFEWAGGDVAFQLSDTDEGTLLKLKETLPLSFGTVSQDFTGWYFHMGNIKRISETGEIEEMNKQELEKFEEEVEQELFG